VQVLKGNDNKATQVQLLFSTIFMISCSMFSLVLFEGAFLPICFNCVFTRHEIAAGEDKKVCSLIVSRTHHKWHQMRSSWAQWA